jgi:hypothetical protein
MIGHDVWLFNEELFSNTIDFLRLGIENSTLVLDR